MAAAFGLHFGTPRGIRSPIPCPEPPPRSPRAPGARDSDLCAGSEARGGGCRQPDREGPPSHWAAGSAEGQRPTQDHFTAAPASARPGTHRAAARAPAANSRQTLSSPVCPPHVARPCARTSAPQWPSASPASIRPRLTVVRSRCPTLSPCPHWQCCLCRPWGSLTFGGSRGLSLEEGRAGRPSGGEAPLPVHSGWPSSPATVASSHAPPPRAADLGP